MAEVILFKIEGTPDGVDSAFKGIQPNHQNPDFNKADYQRVVKFDETTECLRDDRGNPAGLLQHPTVFVKEVDIDTPFIKECCIKKKLIDKISFHFFHSLKGDDHPKNYFIIEMEKVLILKSRLILNDTNEKEKQAKPYLEEVVIAPQIIRWKYKRDSDPCSGEQATEFHVP